MYSSFPLLTIGISLALKHFSMWTGSIRWDINSKSSSLQLNGTKPRHPCKRYFQQHYPLTICSCFQEQGVSYWYLTRWHWEQSMADFHFYSQRDRWLVRWEQGEVPSREGQFWGPLEVATFARYTVQFASNEVNLLVKTSTNPVTTRLGWRDSALDVEYSNSTHISTVLPNYLK
jgi:hypothetical protein